MTQVNADTLIQGYVKLRDMRAELKKAYDLKDEDLKSKMNKIEAYLLQMMQQTGASNLGAMHGTAYQQIQIRAGCNDWPTLWAFQQESGRFDLTEKRVSSKAVQAYQEETGELPPGVDISSEIKIVIRRA